MSREFKERSREQLLHHECGVYGLFNRIDLFVNFLASHVKENRANGAREARPIARVTRRFWATSWGTIQGLSFER